MDFPTNNLHRLFCLPTCFTEGPAILVGTICSQGPWLGSTEGLQPEGSCYVLFDLRLDVSVRDSVTRTETF